MLGRRVGRLDKDVQVDRSPSDLSHAPGGYCRIEGERLEPEADRAFRRPAGEDVWVRFMPWWHAGFAVTVVGTAVFCASQLHDDLPRLFVLLALFGALSALYGLLMAAKLDLLGPGSSNLVYLTGAFVLFAVAVFVFPGAGFLLFALIPHCFMLLELRPAIAAVIGLTAINVGAGVYYSGASGGAVTTEVLYGVLSVVLALLLGVYITRIIDQSRQRADLIEELERTRSELAAVSRLAGARAEQERLAGEIHDSLAQGFTSLVMLLQAAQAALDRGDLPVARQQLSLAEPAARDGLAEARSLIGSLAPMHLQSDSLPGALTRVCEDLGSRFGYASSFRILGDPRPLSHNAEIVLLRAAQEALNNAGRHASASAVHVTLTFGPASVDLTVCDDGRGFDPSEAAGFGLEQLRSRAAQIGGVTEISSSTGGGTTVRVVLPAPARAETDEPGELLDAEPDGRGLEGSPPAPPGARIHQANPAPW
jgi:signal transduction histidine kinase